MRGIAVKLPVAVFLFFVLNIIIRAVERQGRPELHDWVWGVSGGVSWLKVVFFGVFAVWMLSWIFKE